MKVSPSPVVISRVCKIVVAKARRLPLHVLGFTLEDVHQIAWMYALQVEIENCKNVEGYVYICVWRGILKELRLRRRKEASFGQVFDRPGRDVVEDEVIFNELYSLRTQTSV